MIRRLPRFAELQFARECAVHGALSHHSEEDESGWDYLVEFPPEPHSGPEDERPANKNAFVQIKSKRKRNLTCQVKLSNALRAANSRQPWFIILMVSDAGAESVTTFAIHVWKNIIHQSLKAVRRAEIAGVPLHQAK